MTQDIVIRIRRRYLIGAAAAALLLVITLGFSLPLFAQKVQEEYKDKFKLAGPTGDVSVAASADGRYVFVVGSEGVLVSDDHGKTGTWVQTVRMK